MVELLYPHEHLSCFNYEKGSRPVFDKLKLKKGQSWKVFSEDNLIIFILEGSLCFSFGEYLNRTISKGRMMVLPAGSQLLGRAEEETGLIVIRLLETKQLCDCYSLDMLLNERDGSFIPELYYLDIKERLSLFLSFWDECVGDGLKCVFYLDLKVKEFFFMLRAYYTKEELLGFFYLLLSRDISFSDQVMKNRYKAKTVHELADTLHYSLSGFQKRFKKVFGVSAYHWMKEERLKSVFHEINSTQKSFKEISDDYGFSSPAHFNDFCKSNFGLTPGKIRQNKSLPNSKF
ncbi:MAG: helix-turn-helix transcriptional regulator [Prevotella sp.]|jgi:AraC-like DNA-binding protein|nr:helix-turn-helix transcriptional regulator [Prevotella sp.]